MLKNNKYSKYSSPPGTVDRVFEIHKLNEKDKSGYTPCIKKDEKEKEKEPIKKMRH